MVFRVLSCAALLTVTACEEDEGGSIVLDSVVASTEAVNAAIEADEATWLVPVMSGTEVSGTVDGASGGKIVATGWRSSMEHLPGDAQYLAFGEKLFLELDGYNAAGLSLSGNVVVTRHSVDYGVNDKVDDASRMTHYVGSIVAAGAATGSYTIDVHANASGTTLWTCGVINEEETGSGRCY